MANRVPFNFDLSLALLAPYTASAVFPSEEDIRSWRVLPYQTFSKPFLRLWDKYSGSQPVNGILTSRDPTKRLDNYGNRKKSLEIHIDHGKWEKTPFISFTTSPSAIREIANMRSSKRGEQTLTVVDPCIRVRQGMPTLDVEAEMKRYNISDPYGVNGQYYTNHYVCVWTVAADEVVGHWQWSNLASDSKWYDEIIMPAVSRGRSQLAVKHVLQAPFGLSALTRALTGNDCQTGSIPSANSASKVLGTSHNQFKASSDCDNVAQVRQPNTKWSVIPRTTTYVEKLKLLCHSPPELECHGYVTEQLSDSQLRAKLRCVKCGEKVKRAKEPKPGRTSVLSIQKPASTTSLDHHDSVGQLRQLTRTVCMYHTGKVERKHFTCCSKHVSSQGCVGETSHTFEVLSPKFRQSWKFYPTTATSNSPASSRTYPGTVSPASSEVLMKHTHPVQAIALDCEMGTAKSGNTELIRLTAVEFFTSEPLIDTLVQPTVPMQHCNTRYSGVTAAAMRTAVKEKSCLFGRDAARQELMKFIDLNTVVVVHRGQNDLSALRWTHPAVIDTFILEGYHSEMRGGRSLKALCVSLLNIDIQRGKGHDSHEDALACRELVHRWMKVIPD